MQSKTFLSKFEIQKRKNLFLLCCRQVLGCIPTNTERELGLDRRETG